MSFQDLISISRASPLLGKIYHNILFCPSTSYYLKKELQNCDVILDLGCGNNSVLRYIPKKKYSIGIEVFLKSIKESRSKQIHDEYIQNDIRAICIKPKSVDAIIILEVIEHIERSEFIQLIAKLRTIARKKIIVSTPNGFVDQEEYDDNPYQKHRSGWKIEELQDYGFSDFHGVGGLKRFGRGNNSQLLFLVIQCLPQKISYFFPRYANGIIAVMDLEDNQ